MRLPTVYEVSYSICRSRTKVHDMSYGSRDKVIQKMVDLFVDFIRLNCRDKRCESFPPEQILGRYDVMRSNCNLYYIFHCAQSL